MLPLVLPLVLLLALCCLVLLLALCAACLVLLAALLLDGHCPLSM